MAMVSSMIVPQVVQSRNVAELAPLENRQKHLLYNYAANYAQ